MAVATIDGPEKASLDEVSVHRAPVWRRRRSAAWFASGGAAVVLVVLGGYGLLQGEQPSGASDGWDASSRRLEAEAEAYFVEQANLERGWAADSARLQAAADAAEVGAPG